METVGQKSDGKWLIDFLRENPMSSCHKIAENFNMEEEAVRLALEKLKLHGKIREVTLPLGNDLELYSKLFYSVWSNAFRDLRTPDELVAYLSDASRRLENSEYIYHYTSLENAIKIMKGSLWHLADPKDMNDQLEYKNGDRAKWKNIFFASFMAEDKESIGMWSMYAQPWESGVKIAIPSKTAREWIAKTPIVYEISTQTFQKTGRTARLGEGELKLSAVAYTNGFEMTPPGKFKIMWSNQTNEHISNLRQYQRELTGYMKDQAWAYEKEIRIMADFPNLNGFQRVGIDVPDFVINAMILTPSPLFEGDFYEKLHQTVQREVQIDRSLFSGRLNVKSICQNCTWKRRQTIG